MFSKNSKNTGSWFPGMTAARDRYPPRMAAAMVAYIHAHATAPRR